MGKFAVFSERSKAKSVSVSEGLRPSDPCPGALPLDPAGGCIIGVSHLYLGAPSFNSLTSVSRNAIPALNDMLILILRIVHCAVDSGERHARHMFHL